jgi:hypothetical protein
MLDYKVLQAKQRQLKLDLCKWHEKVGTLCCQLNLSQAWSQLHPYLECHAPIPAPPSYYNTHRVKPTSPHTLTMDQALAIDPPGIFHSDRPWYHEQFTVQYTFAEPGSHCTYCKSWDHIALNCHTPHQHCSLSYSCIIPSHHHYFGRNCPATNLHLIDTGDEEGYVGLEESNSKA